LLVALQELQQELEDVVRGFVVSVERLGREFEDVLRVVGGEDNDEDEKVSILPIEPSPEPGNGADEGRRGDKVDQTEYMFVGRSKEEVEKRLGEAGFGFVEEEEQVERVRRNLGEL
jgi:hypothetical protein